MNATRLLRIVFACLVFSGICASASAGETPDTCVLFAARHIARGDGNFYIYCTISTKRRDFRAGDVLEYDIYLYKPNPVAAGGVDIDTNHGNLRDTSAVD